MWVLCQLTGCLGGASPWVSRRCLLGLRSARKQQVGVGKLEGEDLCNPEETGIGHERTSGIAATCVLLKRFGMRIENWIWGWLER